MRRSLLVVVVVSAVAGVPAPVGAGGGEPFTASISRLDRETRELMTGSSWREGCPVGLKALRLVRLTYVGFDGEAHHGRLVVHRRWADEIVEVFRRLYRREFPIRRIRLVDRYGADDRESMRHDNTSAFNCRYVARTTVWSQHAYGRAIDVNPVENPYVGCGMSRDPRARRYLDRSRLRKGMVTTGVVSAFRSIGWGWGGAWTGNTKDYMHFSVNGH